jgi:hypothetical protein
LAAWIESLATSLETSVRSQWLFLPIFDANAQRFFRKFEHLFAVPRVLQKRRCLRLHGNGRLDAGARATARGKLLFTMAHDCMRKGPSKSIVNSAALVDGAP